MFIVYIIYSESFDKYYIGQTNDFNQRLNRHNLGQVISTKFYVPWALKCSINKESRAQAIVLEKKLKNLNRTRLLAFIDKYGVSPVPDDSDL